MKLHSREVLFEQLSFLSYYFHWPLEESINLTHCDRQRFVGEISKINKKVNGEAKNIFEV